MKSLKVIAAIVLACLVLSSSFGLYQECKHSNGVGTRMQNVLIKYGKQVASKTGMQFLREGNVTNVQKTPYCISFRSFDNLTLNESQVLAANLVEDFWVMLQNNPDILAYIDSRIANEKKFKSPIISKREVLIKQVGYRIDFWDKDVNRPKPPYIAEILFQDSHFYFYDADPQTQALRLVLKAPYEQVIAYRNEKLKNSHAQK